MTRPPAGRRRDRLRRPRPAHRPRLGRAAGGVRGRVSGPRATGPWCCAAGEAGRTSTARSCCGAVTRRRHGRRQGATRGRPRMGASQLRGRGGGAEVAAGSGSGAMELLAADRGRAWLVVMAGPRRTPARAWPTCCWATSAAAAARRPLLDWAGLPAGSSSVGRARAGRLAEFDTVKSRYLRERTPQAYGGLAVDATCYRSGLEQACARRRGPIARPCSACGVPDGLDAGARRTVAAAAGDVCPVRGCSRRVTSARTTTC